MFNFSSKSKTANTIIFLELQNNQRHQEDITYFEQVFLKFDKNFEFKKDNLSSEKENSEIAA